MDPDFINSKYYCHICPLQPDNPDSNFVTREGCLVHIWQEHKLSRKHARTGIHLANGYQSRQIHYQRSRAADKEARELREVLSQPNYTVEDFLTDFRAVAQDV